MNSIGKYFLLALCLFGALHGIAQEVDSTMKPDTVIVEKEGRKFYQYIVEPGNTLYSISKQYGLSVKEIEEHNPKAKSGLSIGDTLLILVVAEDKETLERKMEVDGNIIVHEVRKGQTLYAISKIYNIGTGDILAINPEIKKGLKEGQLIKIPVSKLKKVDSTTTEPEIPKDQLIHKVKPKETLYSLSRYYSVGIEDLKSANGGLEEGLKIGMELIIPMEGGSTLLEVDSTTMKETYRIGLILPLFLDLNDTLMSKLRFDEKEHVLTKSAIGLQFYQGFKLALDSIDPGRRKFKLHVYDGGKDSSTIETLLKSGELEQMDLIVGPMYFSQFMEVSKMALKNKIHMVCPIPQSNKVLLGNPYVSKVATSQVVQYDKLAEYLDLLYKSENLIIVTKNFRANLLGHSFKEKLQELVTEGDDSAAVFAVKEIRWDNGSIDALKAELRTDTFNIIILPSDDQAYVTEFLSNLNTIRKDYMFLVIGVDRWLRYTNIDFEYFENLNMMVPADGFIDYRDSSTVDFIEKYNDAYKAFPEKYAFVGGDIAFYYLGLLDKGGTRIEPLLLTEKGRFNYYRFSFFKTGIESGYENQSVFFLKQDHFELKEVLKAEY